jgi:hypothetical protein
MTEPRTAYLTPEDTRTFPPDAWQRLADALPDSQREQLAAMMLEMLEHGYGELRIVINSHEIRRVVVERSVVFARLELDA